MTLFDFSVVVPVYNSEKSLDELYQRISSTFIKMGRSFQVVFIDDNSVDSSWNVLENLKKNFRDNITIVRLSKNFGQHNALLCGFGFAKGEYVVTIDDDLQYCPEDIKVLYEAMNTSGADIVFGIHDEKKHNIVRKIGSWYMYHSSKLSNKTFAGGSFRLIRGEIISKAIDTYHDYVYIDEILSWYTDNISFSEVKHLPRKYNQSNYNSGKLVSHAYHISLFSTAFPLRIMTYGGMISAAIFALIGLFYLIKKFFFHAPMGYTSLIVAILFSAAIMLMCMGILGEYLLRIYKAQNRKPPYSIRKIDN